MHRDARMPGLCTKICVHTVDKWDPWLLNTCSVLHTHAVIPSIPLHHCYHFSVSIWCRLHCSLVSCTAWGSAAPVQDIHMEIPRWCLLDLTPFFPPKIWSHANSHLPASPWLSRGSYQTGKVKANTCCETPNSVICPLPHSWAHRWPWLASIAWLWLTGVREYAIPPSQRLWPILLWWL